MDGGLKLSPKRSANKLSRIARKFKSEMSIGNLMKAGWTSASIAVLVLIVAHILQFVDERTCIGLLAIVFGTCILGVGYYCLVSVLPKKAMETETSISVIALKASYWLAIGGIIIIFLGFLYLMGIIPPPGWEKAKNSQLGNLLY